MAERSLIAGDAAAGMPEAPEDRFLDCRHVLGMRVDVTSYADATWRVIAWAAARAPRMVCHANVHMVMEAYDSPAFRHLVNDADLITADGMPLVWNLRRQGIRGQGRVCGPDLLMHLCAAAARHGLPVGFLGAEPPVLERLIANLTRRFPDLPVAFAQAPPFRPASREADREVIDAINAAGVAILFVGLGCPKQEMWMHVHRPHLRAVMLGVGAAFNFHAGERRRAPVWLQRSGLEWLHRMGTEPQRLWRRYIIQNSRFLTLTLLGSPSRPEGSSDP